MENLEDVKVEENGIPIVDAKQYAKAMRANQYDSTSKAAAEIIDNSIEAGATCIYIFINSGVDNLTGKRVVSSVAFLDNGCGMSIGLLQNCMSIGYSTKFNSKQNMGKFGVGMKYASLFASSLVEVYSWQSKGIVFHSYLDTDEISKGIQTNIGVPIETAFPLDYKVTDFENIFSDHGTMVLWSKVDKEKVRASSLESKLSFDLGRIFRYFINKGLEIFTIVDHKDIKKLMLCDPLFLMDKEVYMGNINGGPFLVSEGDFDNGECLFTPFESDICKNGISEIRVPYLNSKNEICDSIIIIKSSVIKEKFYWESIRGSVFSKPGASQIGKALKKLAKGIYIVRNDRELCYGYYDFYDSINQPNDRWFKIEIDFKAELDDKFKISNNKQNIQLSKNDSEKLAEFPEASVYYPIWSKLSEIIIKLISQMRNRNGLLASEYQGGAKPKGIVSPIIFPKGVLNKDNKNQNNNGTNINSKESDKKIEKLFKNKRISIKYTYDEESELLSINHDNLDNQIVIINTKFTDGLHFSSLSETLILNEIKDANNKWKFDEDKKNFLINSLKKVLNDFYKE